MPNDETVSTRSNAHVPLVSIALCTYNGAKYLTEQLDSLLAQTFGDFEIVAVDDGSSDQTVSILETYARRDSRLRITINATNLGFRRNFEVALRACRGQFIAPCDQDDIWRPEKIATLLEHIDSNTLAYCDSELVDSDGRSLNFHISNKFNMVSTTDPAAFVFANCVSGHAMLFRRDLLKAALPIPAAFFHDWWLAAIAASTGGVVYVSQGLVLYRQHAATVTDFLSASGRVKSKDKRGSGLQAFNQIGERIDALAEHEGKHQSFLLTWRDLWRARNSQWLSIALGVFVFKHRQRLYAILKISAMQRIHRAVKFMVGLRSKRIINRRAYSDEQLQKLRL